MAKLTTKGRNALPKSDFGMPAERKFPMPDANHARNAKSRASQEVNAGRMSPSTEKKIDAKADRVMGKMPERGERTAKHNDTKHPGSHDEWERLGGDK